MNSTVILALIIAGFLGALGLYKLYHDDPSDDSSDD